MEAEDMFCNIDERLEPLEVGWKVVCNQTNNTLDNFDQSKLKISIKIPIDLATSKWFNEWCNYIQDMAEREIDRIKKSIFSQNSELNKSLFQLRYKEK